MKRYYSILVFFALAISTNAQISVSARYLNNSSDGLESLTDDAKFRAGYEVGLGYWFRLKTKRMEFTPEVSYASMDSDLTSSSIAFNFNTLIYPLDFHSDCDACPTFSKEGGLVKKGFYWVISPGIINVNTNNENHLTYRLGAGLGLDVGVTNLLTLSPFAMYNFMGTAFRTNFNRPAAPSEWQLNQVHFGVRATLRFDKNKW